MIKSKEEYYSILERLRALNFNQKLGRNLQAKLEAFEEMEELVNLTIPVVVQQSEQLFCECDTPNLYERHLGDGGYDWCKCDKMVGAK
tara:strand:- start:345 stop:608 length:264 start_codon:yes stop_codon:yes gene_type:complete